MANKMAGIAPCLWAFLDMILSANTSPSESTDLSLDSVDGLDDTYWDVTEEQDGQSTQGMHSDRMGKKVAVTNIVRRPWLFNLELYNDHYKISEKSYHSEHRNEKYCTQC
jgi:hypothetical protein